MDFELDLSSENMTSFLELEQEIKEAATISLPPPLPRPSVIVKPRAKPAPLPSRISMVIDLDTTSLLARSL